MLDGDSLNVRLGLGQNGQNGCHDDTLCSNDSFTSVGGNCVTRQLLAQEADKFRDGLEARCSDSPGNSPCKERRKDSQSSIEREIALLNKEMEFIQIECEEIVEKHLREQEKLRTHTECSKADSVRSPRMVPRMGTKMDYHKQLLAQEGGQELPWANRAVISPPPPLPPKAPKTPEKRLKEDRDTSTSAYNTGDSLRSTPLTMELSAAMDEGGLTRTSLLHVTAANKPSHSDSEKATQAGQETVREWSSDGDKHRQLMPHRSPSKSMGISENSAQTQTPTGDFEEEDKSLQELYTQYADVMYTNRENLEHTMKVQQKLFEQQLMKRAKSRQESQHAHSLTSTPEKETQSKLQNMPCTSSASQQDSSVPMEWVVKRRADGSRYITRRPIRAKILKERAKKIIEERCGMTTDDDAMSEMKLGRYWSKEDRRRHLEKARDQRRKKEFMMKTRMETVKEGEEGRNKVLELSHRKMMKHKGKKVLDNFTTVQEMVAHGSKDATTNKNYNPLLSVTTV
jgi:ligand of Numb protein X 3/4